LANFGRTFDGRKSKNFKKENTMISTGQLLILGVFMLLSWIVSAQLKSRFRRYSQIPVNYGMSGKDVAEKMLHENGVHDVSVISVEGQLTDHYNPLDKTVNLSRDVYNGKNVSAAAVAAHECGHAIQHAHSYAPLKLRSALVPVQNVSAKIMNIIFIAMFFGAFAFRSIFSFDLALIVIIVCYGIFTLFAMITLPVEINASQRALAWLNNSNITGYDTAPQAKDALKWAAYSYVVAALSSLAMLLYPYSCFSAMGLMTAPGFPVKRAAFYCKKSLIFLLFVF
jgi:Zn-dependent membrane protease YugP